MFNEKEIKMAEMDMAKSSEDYGAAKELVKITHYNGALNRAYYSIFHLMCARLVLDGLGFSKHSAVIGKFRELYLNKDFEGDLKKRLSDIITDSETLRNSSDYERGFYADEAMVKKTLEDVKFFNDTILAYINNLISENESRSIKSWAK